MSVLERIKSFDNLSADEQDYLLDILNQKRKQSKISMGNDTDLAKDATKLIGDTFGEGLQRFRNVIDEEGIIFTDDDFANLRDRSLGREVEL
jgi:hypothetical protein